MNFLFIICLVNGLRRKDNIKSLIHKLLDVFFASLKKIGWKICAFTVQMWILILLLTICSGKKGCQQRAWTSFGESKNLLNGENEHLCEGLISLLRKTVKICTGTHQSS